MIYKFDLYKKHIKEMKKLLLFFTSVALSLSVSAQESRKISLEEAISLGLENSKVLKLSQAKVDQAVSRYEQTKDAALPTGTVSYVYNHAEIPTTTFQMGGGSEPFHLPTRADAFIGTFGLQEVVFGGNRLRYAKESTSLLTKVANLDAEKDREDIIFNITNAYFNLYKLQQSQKVVQQNLESIEQQIKQSQRFFEQGIVTKNDVLGFQLQKSNIQLAGVDLETNRKIVVYNLDILLGLPENTSLSVGEITSVSNNLSGINQFIDTALVNRTELSSLDLRTKVAETAIKSIKAELLPSVLVGANAYYINPSGKFIPPTNSFLAPLTVGATVAWNFDRLWMNKNKITEAKIEKRQVELSKDLTVDNVKTEVNQNYQNYQRAIERIGILETAITQARENDRILESKYRNNIASVTDRIEAQTQLYQSLINLELAKADAGIAYYTLLKSAGTISK